MDTSRSMRRFAFFVGVLGGSACLNGATELPQGQRVHAVALGDVNGDGHLDLVVTDMGEGGPADDRLVVRLGDGTGAFGPESTTPMPDAARTEAILVTDLTGDGVLDVATANTELFNLSVFAGAGDGTFSILQTHVTSEEPQRIAAADFDGDGLVDLAVACRDDGGQYANTLRGTGGGAFGPRTIFSEMAGTVAFGVAVGDVDNDGDLDLVTAGISTLGALRVHQNDGSGALIPLPFFGTGALRDVALADLDDDCLLDLVAVRGDELVFLLGNGDGTFGPEKSFALGGFGNRLAVADIDADGHMDIAVTRREDDRVTILWGRKEKLGFVARSYATGGHPVTLALGDLDENGRLDVVTGNRTSPGSVTILLNPTN